MKLIDCSAGRRRYRPRSDSGSRRRSAAPWPPPADTPLSTPNSPSGGIAITNFGTPLPEKTLQESLASDAVLMGAVGDNKFNALPPSERPEAGLLKIRKELGGFANLRPSVAYPALAENSPLRADVTKGTDILFVRELLGGLYFGEPRAWDKVAGKSWNTMVYTKDEVVRVAKVAFELAQKRRKKVTSVDKANVLEVSQLWRATVDEVAKNYPDVTVEHQLVDSMAMHLMNIPRNFDVVLTENLFGDILSDEAGVITGSLGMLPSATIGGKVNLYEPVHGSAPDIAGTGKANPLGRDPDRSDGASPLRRPGKRSRGRRSLRHRRARQGTSHCGHRPAAAPSSKPLRWARLCWMS